MRRAALIALVALAATSCAQVLGIEDARVDPSLSVDTAAGGTGAGAGGAGEADAAAGANSGGAAGGGGGQAAGGASSGGAAGSGGSTSADASTDANADAASPDLCTRYCQAVMTTCAGAVAVYASEVTCRATCAALEPGAPGDTTGNSVECRLRAAGLAVDTGETALYCPMAGTGGDGTCGSNCEGYCAVMLELCPSAFPAATDCMGACATVPDQGGYTTATTSGDSLQCRLYHMGAATLDAALHCPHAAGSAVCVP